MNCEAVSCLSPGSRYRDFPSLTWSCSGNGAGVRREKTALAEVVWPYSLRLFFGGSIGQGRQFLRPMPAFMTASGAKRLALPFNHRDYARISRGSGLLELITWPRLAVPPNSHCFGCIGANLAFPIGELRTNRVSGGPWLRLTLDAAVQQQFRLSSASPFCGSRLAEK